MASAAGVMRPGRRGQGGPPCAVARGRVATGSVNSFGSSSSDLGRRPASASTPNTPCVIGTGCVDHRRIEVCAGRITVPAR